MQTDLAGRILIAMPSIGDGRFERSVILICAHDEEYAMGIVLNKPVAHLTLPFMLEQLDVDIQSDLADGFVLDGGPVRNDRGFVLHSADFHCEGATIDIGDSCRLTATRDILDALASEKPPEKAVLALGYSGWGPGQLEAELVENAWLVGDLDECILYGPDHDRKWNDALRQIGVNSGRIQAGSGQA